jgi:hypothetical protein
MKAIIRSLIALVITTALFSAQPARWSAEQQEILDHITVCWNAWVEAAEKNDPEIWFKKCPVAENAAFWSTAEGAPDIDAKAMRRDWETIRKQTVGWIDLRPVSVNVYGDVAVVHFYSYWKVRTENGTETVEQKRLEVFKKMAGKWTLIGQQRTPVVAGR